MPAQMLRRACAVSFWRRCSPVFSEVSDGGLDPAAEHSTHDRSAGYAAIDRLGR